MDGIDWSVALGLPALVLIVIAARLLVGRGLVLALVALALIAGLAWLVLAHPIAAGDMVVWTGVPFTAMLIPLGEILVVLSLVALYAARRY